MGFYYDSLRPLVLCLVSYKADIHRLAQNCFTKHHPLI